MDQQKIQMFKEMLYHSDKIVFFGGAGVSTESGIPDFRSADGLYMQDSGYTVSAEEIISHSFAVKYPKIFFDYYFKHLVYPDAKPSYCHRYLAQMEQQGQDIEIVTQNVDGLHQKAGSKKVWELHGSVVNNYCVKCGKTYKLDELQKDQDGIPRCTEDQAIVRPDIVLYEEGLDEKVVYGAVQAISKADLMIVAGTSLNVYPAAGLLNFFGGSYMVVINKTPIQVPFKDALVFQEAIDDVFKAL